MCSCARHSVRWWLMRSGNSNPANSSVQQPALACVQWLMARGRATATTFLADSSNPPVLTSSPRKCPCAVSLTPTPCVFRRVQAIPTKLRVLFLNNWGFVVYICHHSWLKINYVCESKELLSFFLKIGPMQIHTSYTMNIAVYSVHFSAVPPDYSCI